MCKQMSWETMVVWSILQRFEYSYGWVAAASQYNDTSDMIITVKLLNVKSSTGTISIFGCHCTTLWSHDIQAKVFIWHILDKAQAYPNVIEFFQHHKIPIGTLHFYFLKIHIHLFVVIVSVEAGATWCLFITLTLKWDCRKLHQAADTEEQTISFHLIVHSCMSFCTQQGAVL